MARAQTEETVSASNDEMVTVTIPRSMLRYLPVEPAEFAQVKQQLGLSNKEIAEAIGRTLSRVSELTNSKGASRIVFEDFVAKVTEYRENHPRADA